MAAKKGHHEVVVVLMAYNADTTIKDEVLVLNVSCMTYEVLEYAQV